MTPKDKAHELIWLYLLVEQDKNADKNKAKQCALIAVAQIIKEHYPQDAKRCEYWNQVKTEIEKL